MPTDESIREPENDMKLCMMARTALGQNDRPLSRAKFAALTGVSSSILFRRETGETGLPPESRTLYELLVELEREGLIEEAREALNEVPKASRSEDRASISLAFLCYRKNLEWLVRSVMGDPNASPSAPDKDANITGSLSILKRFQGELLRQARQLDPQLGRHLESASEALNTASYHIERFEQERSEVAELGDEESGDD